MAFVENPAEFFDTENGFSVAALWNGTTTVVGDDGADYLEAMGNIVQGSAPTFLAPAAAMPGVKHDDTLAYSGNTYKVRGVEPDGTGMVLLRLEKQ